MSSTPSFSHRIPSGSWDSHMHILDPTRYPIAKVAIYVPEIHTLSEAMQFESSSHNIEKMVIVQPSIFGTDNSNLIDALKELGPEKGRAVVCINPDNVDHEELKRWHELGARGLRLNFVSLELVPTPNILEQEIKRHADIAKSFDWVVQVYIPLHLFQSLVHVVPSLPVRFVVDHFGDPDFQHLQSSSAGKKEEEFNPYSLPGFPELITLLKQGNTFIKLSAPYRAVGIKGLLDSSYIDTILRELLRADSSKLVFATDWPHTRFEGLDIKPFTQRVLSICNEIGGDDCVDMVFRRNAEALWSPRS
ncbi:hypothetical protein KEM54_006165 [Ascosphaera aggregata]|nr:hypothetical protein KEM54_006165 [Ascosphaera aggregata]